MSNLIDLNTFKKKQEEKKTQQRPPLSPQFSDRLANIRASLEKINRLMEELKRMYSSVDKSKT